VTRAPDAGHSPLLEVRGLVKRYPLDRRRREGGRWVDALNGLSFDVVRGETLGLVGESGCGKTTAAKAILRLVEPTSGSVRFDGEEVTAMDRAAMNRLRCRVQLVFQDSAGSFDPRLSVAATLQEVLSVHGHDRRSSAARTVELLEQVGLSASEAGRYPHELSGGQRQRLGIARALAVEPELLVLDEPVSALDVSVRAQVVNLLQDLKDRLRLTYVFIAHDLTLVRHICDRVVVMYAGRAMEITRATDLERAALHPYTRELLAAVPRVDGSRRRRGSPREAAQTGMTHSPTHAGCPWAERCAHPKKDALCVAVLPPLEEVSDGRRVACLKALSEAESGA
jgi:oligopeptide transport system ATP-binding protein